MYFIEAILCGLYGYVMANILTEPDMIFNKLYLLLKKLPVWFFKPIIGCSYCVAGQAALWVYLIRNFHSYDIISHVFFIVMAIFTVELTTSIINKLNK